MDSDTAIREALGRGDCLVAHDLARQAVAVDPDDVRARYLAVLALARSGAALRAAEEYDELGLGAVPAAELPMDLAEDIAVLEARLAKDAALAASGTERRRLSALAAAHYEAAYRTLGRYYACVNAATMWRLAGDPDRSRSLAAAALDIVGRSGSDTDYWSLATEAEAYLLLDDVDRARGALERAVALDPDIADRASTRRQLLLVCAESGVDDGLLDVLQVPRVVHFAGHMVDGPGRTGRMDPSYEGGVRKSVDRVLAERDVGFGYGALACGADLIVAEALLARGAELHVVLPFDADAFVRTSVLPGGTHWLERFDRCLAAATAVHVVADHGTDDDAVLFAHGTDVAMGKAILRASYLGSEAEQVVVWDEQASGGTAGTGRDVEAWREASRVTHVIPVVRSSGPPEDPSDDGETRDRSGGTSRVVRSMLFADVRGFSRLSEPQIPAFVDHVLRPLAAALDRFASNIRFRNSWGDGLYVVFDDIRAAAECALSLQEAMGRIDLLGAGLPGDLALRIGGHAGPVFAQLDPVTGRDCFYGVEVTRTARIEPGTPVGDVYVTDAFAALIALSRPEGLGCQYVGPLPTAKGFGVLPLYALRRTG